MSRVALALGLGLALAAWAGPVRARALAPETGETSETLETADTSETGETGETGETAETADTSDEAPMEPPIEGDGVEADATVRSEAAPSPSAPAPTHDVPADDFEREPSLAPGGYYGHGVILERPPPDGRNRIIVGSILAPLGLLATVSSAVGTWMTVPSHCTERLGAVGIEATASRCQGLFTFNVIRTTYGALMLGSGATIFALGMIQRERYRRWRNEHGMSACLAPTMDLGARGASLGLRVRF